MSYLGTKKGVRKGLQYSSDIREGRMRRFLRSTCLVSFPLLPVTKNRSLMHSTRCCPNGSPINFSELIGTLKNIDSGAKKEGKTKESIVDGQKKREAIFSPYENDHEGSSHRRGVMESGQNSATTSLYSGGKFFSREDHLRRQFNTSQNFQLYTDDQLVQELLKFNRRDEKDPTVFYEILTRIEKGRFQYHYGEALRVSGGHRQGASSAGEQQKILLMKKMNCIPPFFKMGYFLKCMIQSVTSSSVMSFIEEKYKDDADQLPLYQSLIQSSSDKKKKKQLGNIPTITSSSEALPTPELSLHVTVLILQILSQYVDRLTAKDSIEILFTLSLFTEIYHDDIFNTLADNIICGVESIQNISDISKLLKSASVILYPGKQPSKKKWNAATLESHRLLFSTQDFHVIFRQLCAVLDRECVLLRIPTYSASLKSDEKNSASGEVEKSDIVSAAVKDSEMQESKSQAPMQQHVTPQLSRPPPDLFHLLHHLHRLPHRNLDVAARLMTLLRPFLAHGHEADVLIGLRYYIEQKMMDVSQFDDVAILAIRRLRSFRQNRRDEVTEDIQATSDLLRTLSQCIHGRDRTGVARGQRENGKGEERHAKSFGEGKGPKLVQEAQSFGGEIIFNKQASLKENTSQVTQHRQSLPALRLNMESMWGLQMHRFLALFSSMECFVSREDYNHQRICNPLLQCSELGATLFFVFVHKINISDFNAMDHGLQHWVEYFYFDVVEKAFRALSPNDAFGDGAAWSASSKKAKPKFPPSIYKMTHPSIQENFTDELPVNFLGFIGKMLRKRGEKSRQSYHHSPPLMVKREREKEREEEIDNLLNMCEF